MEGINVVHVREDHDVYGARHGSKDDDCKHHLLNTYPPDTGWLGNPFEIKEHGGDYTRQESVYMYLGALITKVKFNPSMMEHMNNLSGKDVACYCRYSDEDEPLCHLDMVNRYIRYIQG